MDLHFRLPLVLQREPHIGLVVQLIDEFEERPLLKQVVADFVLYAGEHLEELPPAYLRVPQDVAEGIDQSCLELQQGLEGNLVYALEARAIEVGEKLDLELVDQVLIDLGHKYLPQYSVVVHSKFFLNESLFNQSLSLLLSDDGVPHEAVDDHGLLLPLRCLEVEEGVHFIDVEEH